METVKTFIKEFSALEPGKTPIQKFHDFLEMAYCAVSKPMADPHQAETLEARYMQIVGTYRDKDAVRAYPKLLSYMILALQTDGDFLGMVSAELGALNSQQGQFFTPYEVSRLMAEMNIGDIEPEIQAKGYVTIQEPASGAGGMILAAAHTLRRRGYHPETQMLVTAIDVSAQCYWMTYLQLALSGIPAQVFHGNTLSMEMFSSAWTPGIIGFLEMHGDVFAEQPQQSPEPDINLQPMQLALF
jgi:hypothetical protein